MIMWILNIVVSWALFFFCVFIGFYLTLQSYENNGTDMYLIHSVDGSYILFHLLWQKFWSPNTICVAIWKKNWRQTLGHVAGMITYSSGMMKSHDKPQTTTLLNPDRNKDGAEKDARVCHHSEN